MTPLRKPKRLRCRIVFRMAVVVATLLFHISLPYTTNAYDDGEIWNQNGIIQVLVDVESIELVDHPDLYSWTVSLDQVPMQHHPHQGTLWIGSYPVDLDWERQKKRLWRSSGSINLPVDIVDGNANDPHNKGTPAATFVVSLWLGPKQNRHSGESSSAQTILARRMVTLRSQQPVATVSLIARSIAREVPPKTSWSVTTVLLVIGKAALLFVLGVIVWGAWLNHREKIEARRQARAVEYQYHHHALVYGDHLSDQHHRHDEVDCPSPTLYQQTYPPRVTPHTRSTEWDADRLTASRFLNLGDEDCPNDFCAQELDQSPRATRLPPSRRTVRFQDEVMVPSAAGNRQHDSQEHDWTVREERPLRCAHSAAVPDQRDGLHGPRESTMFSDDSVNDSVVRASPNRHTANLSRARQQECRGASANSVDAWSTFFAIPNGKATTANENLQGDNSGTVDHLPVHNSVEAKQDAIQTIATGAAYSVDGQTEESQASVKTTKSNPDELENICTNQRAGEPCVHRVAAETKHTDSPPRDVQENSEMKECLQHEPALDTDGVRQKYVDRVQEEQKANVASQIHGPGPLHISDESQMVSKGPQKGDRDEPSTDERPVGRLHEVATDVYQVGGCSKSTAVEPRSKAPARTRGPTPRVQSREKQIHDTSSPSVVRGGLSGQKRIFEETVMAVERSDPNCRTDSGGIGAASQNSPWERPNGSTTSNSYDAGLQNKFAESTEASPTPLHAEVGGWSGCDPRVDAPRTKYEAVGASTLDLLQAGKQESGEGKSGINEQTQGPDTNRVSVPALPVLQGHATAKKTDSFNPHLQTGNCYDVSPFNRKSKDRALMIQNPMNGTGTRPGSLVSQLLEQIDDDLHGKKSCDPCRNILVHQERAQEGIERETGMACNRRAKHPRGSNQSTDNETSGLHSAAKMDSEFASRPSKKNEIEPKGPLLKGISKTKTPHEISSPKLALSANVSKVVLAGAMDAFKEGTIEGQKDPHGTCNPKLSPKKKTKKVIDPDDDSRPPADRNHLSSEYQEHFQAKGSESLEIAHSNDEPLAEDGKNDISLQLEDRRFDKRDPDEQQDADGHETEESAIEEESTGPITSTLRDSCTIQEDKKSLKSNVNMSDTRYCAGFGELQHVASVDGQRIAGSSSSLIRGEASGALKENKDATLTPRQVISLKQGVSDADKMKSSSPIPDDGYNSQVSYVSTLPPHSDCTPTPETIANVARPPWKERKALCPKEQVILDFNLPHHDDPEGKRRKQQKRQRLSRSFKPEGKTVQLDMSQHSPQQQFRTPVPSIKDADGDDSVHFVKAVCLTDPVPDASLSCSLKSVAKKLGRRKMWEFDGGEGTSTTVSNIAAGKRPKREENIKMKNTIVKRVKTNSRRNLFSKK